MQNFGFGESAVVNAEIIENPEEAGGLALGIADEDALGGGAKGTLPRPAAVESSIQEHLQLHGDGIVNRGDIQIGIGRNLDIAPNDRGIGLKENAGVLQA